MRSATPRRGASGCGCGCGCALWLLALVLSLHCVFVSPSSSTAMQLQQKDAVHRTAAAAERANDLRCFVCESMDPLHGPSCVSAPRNNTKQFDKRCRDDARICMTKKFSYTTSTENTTSEARLFSLERNCTSRCEPGCIIIGERTKLYACTQCCETSLCNTGNGAAAPSRRVPLSIGVGIGISVVGHVLWPPWVSASSPWSPWGTWSWGGGALLLALWRWFSQSPALALALSPLAAAAAALARLL